MRNIRYYPVMDCGGFGGNWYWNHHITPPPPNYGKGIGLFSFGYEPGEVVTTTNIYTYSSNTVALGTNLLASSYRGSGAGNVQLAVINTANNQYSTNTNIYTYSSNDVVMGTAFQYGSIAGSASGNSILGIYLWSNNGIGGYQQYMYANNTTSSTNNNRPYYWGLSSTGTSTFGLFNLGSSGTANNYAMTNIYQYSNNTISNGTNIFNGIYRQNGGNAAGNATIGVFNVGGYFDNNNWLASQLALNIYTYSSNAVTTGVTLCAPSRNGMATGNDVAGVFTLGNNVATTNVYTYNNNAVVVGTNLTVAGSTGTGTSSYNPGVNT